jgi:hypothetical protein
MFPILNGFFQQDEWLAYSEYIRISKNLKDLVVNFFAPNVTHYVPLGRLVGFLEYQLFHLNYLPYAISGLLLHIFTSVLLFYLIRKVIDNKFISILASFIFLFADYGYQVITWPTGNVQNQISVISALWCLILFLKFVDEGRRRLFWYSIILLFLSLSFKENAIAFFLFLPLIFYLYASKEMKTKYFYPVFIFITGVLYGSLRVLMIFITSNTSETAIGGQTKLSLLYNLVTFPIKGVAQSIVPVDSELLIATKLTLLLPVRIRGMAGTTGFDIFVQKRMLEILSFLICTTVVFFSLYIYKKIKDGNLKRLIIFSLLFIVINSFIYAFSPDRVGIIPIIDSRNLYFLTTGSSILISIFVYLVYKKRRIAAVLFTVLFFGINLFYLQKDSNLVQAYGTERKSILYKIKRDYPKLPNPVIVYTESDSSFYGLPENERTLPFQSGFGETILVWYQSTNHFPIGFFDGIFLWPIDSEGYKVIDGTGFGYFRNFEHLAKYVSDNKLDKKTIISYSYNSQINSLTDISSQVQGRIDGFVAKKRVISNKNFKLTTSTNENDIKKAFDANIKTLWDSKLAYSNYQYIQIDMGKTYNVSQLVINSGEDKNQNNVGYKVMVSKDTKNWIEVFSSKKYPPGTDGIDNIYFEPTIARYIKIEQIGKHKYASWVINELTVYEKI